MLGMIGLSCYILADAFFVAQGVGGAGLTALNLALPVYSLIYGVGIMIGMGGATRFSICIGGGKKDEGSRVFSRCVWLAAGFSIVMVMAGIFLSGRFATLLGADETVHGMTEDYLRILLLFSPMFIVNNILMSFVRNDGNPRLAMTAMLVGSLSNIVLDYIMIFLLGMGIAGAALATAMSPIIGILILSLHFIKKRNNFCFKLAPPGIRALADICVLGVPSLVMEMSSGVVIILFNMVILGLAGNTGVAAYGVIGNIYLVVLSIFNGISQGVQPIISLNLGRGNLKNIRLTLRYALITAFILSAAVYALTFIFSEPIARAFDRDGNEMLVLLASDGMKLYFTALAFVGVNIVVATYLSSADMPKYASIISILRGFAVIIPVVMLLSPVLGITGVWLSPLVAEFIVLGFSLGFYKRSKSTLKSAASIKSDCADSAT